MNTETLVEYLSSKGIRTFAATGHEVTAHCFLGCCDGKSSTVKGKGKLYLNTETWLWDCKVGGTTGNRKTLLAHFGDVDESTYLPGANPASKLSILTEYTAATQAILEDNDTALDYLFDRGLSAQTILDARIGYAPKSYSVCKSLPTKHSLADLKASGMVTERGTEFHSGKITIPYLSRDHSLQVRGKDMQGKYMTPPGDQVRLYNADALRGAEEVLITEGEFDCLIVQQHLSTSPDPKLRRIAVVAVPGTQSLPGGNEGFPEYFRDAKRVFIGFDPDDAGKKGAIRAKELLGSKARIVQLPDEELVDSEGHAVSCDWSEYLRRETIDHPFGGHGASDIGDLVRSAEMAGKRVFNISEVAAAWRQDKLARPGLKLGWPSLDAVLSPGLRPGNVAIPLAKTGVGKGNVLWEEVVTPQGWKKWGDLVEGDQVYGRDGNVTTVTAIYDRGLLPTYRVTFSDHSSLLVDEDHLWCVAYRYGHRREWKETVMSTAELLKADLRHNKEYRYIIPMAGALRFPEQDLPVEPYTLGSLIANGSMVHGSAYLTTPDRHVVERIRQKYTINWHKNVGATCERGIVQGVIGEIRKLGLNVKSGEKFIPVQYLHGSVQQRIALLQGLMDGDGSARGTGRSSVLYHTTSRKLARDVCQLVTSLGGTAMERWYDRGEKGWEGSIGIMLPLDISPFSTVDKERGDTTYTRVPRRAIVSVERVEDQEIRCISVDAPDHLYVVGRQHIVTHNTVFLANVTYQMRNVPWMHVTLENTKEEFFELLWRIYHFHNPLAEDVDIETAFPYLGFYDENRLNVDDFGLLLEEYREQFGCTPEGGSIDYLGYMAHQAPGSGGYEKNTTAIMRTKEMAKHARMALIVPSQVNRGVKDGAAFEGDEARDSGVIEETADFLFGLYRPAEAVDAARAIDPGRVTHDLVAQILKSRRGGKGKIARLAMSHASLAIVDAADSVLLARVQQENEAMNRGAKYPEIYRDSRDVALGRAQMRLAV